MINDSSQPIYFYPDQLLKENWPAWVEDFFSKIPDTNYHHARGFQELSGSLENSTVRTRAGEAYRLGLLLQRVIRERSEGGGDMPRGWKYVCEGRTPVSRLGYLSYAIGKALSVNEHLAEAKSALNILYLLFSLSLGIRQEESCFSTALIYAWVLERFRRAIGESDFNSKYEEYSRYIAAAVFRTLDDTSRRQNLLIEYVNDVGVGTLVLEKKSDGSIHDLTPFKLADKINGLASDLPNVSVDIPSAKAPLFWAAPGRGIYQQAALAGSELIEKTIPLDRNHIKTNGTSLLTPAIQLVENQDHLLVENLISIFSRNIELSKVWGRMMETLAKGVYEALAYIESSSNVDSKPKEFWLHGVSSIPGEENSLFIELNLSAVPVLPDSGCRVYVCDRPYILKNIEADDQSIKLALELLPD
jgi:hypothetical protein